MMQTKWLTRAEVEQTALDGSLLAAALLEMDKILSGYRAEHDSAIADFDGTPRPCLCALCEATKVARLEES